MFARAGLLLGVALHCIPAHSSQAAEIDHLRHDLAMRFLEPEPYMALAKYLHAEGDRLTAFHLLEEARRTKFEEKVFDAAFQRHFLGQEPFDNSPAAEARLKAELPARPDAAVALADIYISRGDWTPAKSYLRQVIARGNDDLAPNAALARVLEMEGKGEEGQQLLGEWMKRHPDTKEAYTYRIGQLIDSKPAEARALLAKAMELFPAEAAFPFNLGTILQKEDKLDEAEAQFLRAVAFAPANAYIQGWTARFFLKVRGDRRKSLEYSLNAYFL